MTRKRLAAHVALITALSAGPLTAHAGGIPVIDGANLSQTVMTAIESVAQTLKQIEQYQTQLQQYENQLQNTVAPAAYATVAEAVTMAQGEVHLAGSAAPLLAAQWPQGRPKPLLRQAATAAPDIVWVARLGAIADAEFAPAKPLYLRAPDARPQDAARLPRR